MRARALALLLAPLMAAGRVEAQDTLRLDVLQEAAVAHDPRTRELALQESALRLRLADIGAERLPQLRLDAEASHQSETTTIPVHVAGLSIPQPPLDHYQALLEVDQLLWDGGARSGRSAVERAQTAEQEAELRSTLYGLRAQVSDAFFSALNLQAQLEENAALAGDLESQFRVVRAQFAAGTALPGDTAALVVKLLQAEDDRSELTASRAASLGVLARLTGRAARPADVLAVPVLAGAVQRARADRLRARPEYVQFERTRERLARQAAQLASDRRPQLSAYVQAAVARPGLNQFSTTADHYWIGGVRLQWQPWRWGSIGREQADLELQREMVAAEEDAFTAQLDRQVQDDLATIDRLAPALARDDRIVLLREEIEREARAQLGERALTAAQYVDRRTDLTEARLTRARHQVELAQAEAHYLTTLGVEPR